MTEERRRPHACPSCGGSTLVRGQAVEGMSIGLTPTTEEGPAVTVPVCSDVCYECGMVCLFVRVSQVKGSGR